MENTVSSSLGPTPPPLSPPPVIQPPPSTRGRRGRGWMIFALVLLALLVVGFIVVSTTFVGSLMRFEAPYTRTAGPRLDEVLLEDNSASVKVAVLELDGIITGAMIDPAGFNLVDVVKAQLKRAAEDTRVKAVVLKVDSPGGEVLASDEINRAIAEFQKRSGKPVVASLGNLAASGGYYVAVSSRWIVANEMTLTGSIGVIMSAWNYRGLMNKVGVRPYTYKSGKFKDMLSGSRDPDKIPPEEEKMLQDLIDEVYRQFKSVVADGREAANKKNASAGQTLSSEWETYADGRVLSGSEAFKLGFVDELGNFDLAVARARKLAGLSKANVVRYQQRIDLADLFRFFGKSEARSVKVDLGIEFPKLNAGQLYFLPPTHLY